MRKCCKNCKHFVNTRTTERGYKPYFGNCDAGHPIYAGKTFVRKGMEFAYCDFKLANDAACKDYDEVKEENG